MKKVVLILFTAISVLTVWLVLEWNRMEKTVNTPGPATPGDTSLLLIKKGDRFSTVMNRLKQSGLITDPVRVEIYARLHDFDTKLKAGEYLLSSSMTPKTILEKLKNGDIYLRKLTIPEGFNVKQIACEFEKNGFGSEKEFLETAGNKQLIRKLGLSGNSLEGYLFPDSYHLPGRTHPESLIRMMVKKFKEIYSEKWKQRTRELGFTTHEIVILASIIEKETGSPDERALISSVFHNRLKKGMRLESDPTVIFGIDNFNGNLTKKDLRTPSPYNTYLIHRLPPGPIANPGKDSIEAALYPEKTKYLYFVAKGDGTHYFSSSLTEHNRAVQKYQISKRKTP